MEKVQTPLEKLIADKERIKVLSKIQENKLNANLQYLQQNGGKLLMSSVTSAVFPNTKSKVKRNTSFAAPSSVAAPTIAGLALGGAADYFTKGKHILPLALSIVQPLLFTWGIKGLKKLVKNILAKKK